MVLLIYISSRDPIFYAYYIHLFVSLVSFFFFFKDDYPNSKLDMMVGPIIFIYLLFFMIKYFNYNIINYFN